MKSLVSSLVVGEHDVIMSYNQTLSRVRGMCFTPFQGLMLVESYDYNPIKMTKVGLSIQKTNRSKTIENKCANFL